MSKRNLLLLGFAVVVAAQLAVPAWLIIEREWTLRDGQVFKFKTRPIDPADAFRGRYVWLGLEPDKVKMPNANQWLYNQKAFAVLGADSNGFAVVTQLEREWPTDAIAVPVRTRWSDTNGNVYISWSSLDRYYMTEKKAPDAESTYREHNRGTNRTCHVTVRVLGKRAVLENLYIEDKPIHAWLKAHPAGK